MRSAYTTATGTGDERGGEAGFYADGYVMPSDLSQTIDRARLVREDCVTDAEALDRTPFTPRGIGEALGSMLAQIAALAKCIEEIAADREVEDSSQ